MKKKTYVVIIELQYESENIIEQIYTLMKSIGDVELITQFSFLLNTSYNAVFIRDFILHSTYNIDRIFVISAGIPVAWNKTIASNYSIKTLLSHE